jgi:hypothetical protein
LIQISHFLMQMKTSECWMIPCRLLHLKTLKGHVYDVKPRHAHKEEERTHILQRQRQNGATGTVTITSEVIH